MRRGADYFGDEELCVIYIARTLKDALRLEDVLTAGRVDYAVEADEYAVGRILRTKRVGAFFLVRPSDEAGARDVMRHAGFEPFAQPAS